LKPSTPPPWILAALLCVVPILGIHAAFLLSSSHQVIPSCLPYLQGCTSISAAGRQPPGSFAFKASMLPVAGLSLVFWALCGSWLQAIGDRARGQGIAIGALGIVGALFLVLYVTFLGSSGEFYGLMRRYGTTVYFSFTYLAQLLVVGRLMAIQQQRATGFAPWIVKAMAALAAIALLAGLATIPLRNFVEDDDALENILEWNVALLMHLQFGLIALAMHGSRIRLTLQVDSPPVDQESGQR